MDRRVRQTIENDHPYRGRRRRLGVGLPAASTYSVSPSISWIKTSNSARRRRRARGHESDAAGAARFERARDCRLNAEGASSIYGFDTHYPISDLRRTRHPTDRQVTFPS